MPTSKTKEKMNISPENMEELNEGTSDKLKKQLKKLKETSRVSLQKAMRLEMELHSVKADRDLYRRRFSDAQSKIEQLSSVPQPVGTVEKIIDQKRGRFIVRLSTGQQFVAKFDPKKKLEEGDVVALHQRSMSVLEVLPPLFDNKIKKMELMQIPKESYTDIGGLDQEIEDVREVLEFSLTNPEIFTEFNIIPPQGVLLHGPPGTGKTLMAKAVANAAHAKFLYLAAPELVQKYIGEGARIVREIFHMAREDEDSVIIFIDEIDAIASRRSAGEVQSGEREVNRTLMQLLAEMDGFGDNSSIRIIAATNRIDILDPAILRPGRFDRIIELPHPDIGARVHILKIHSSQYPTYRLNLEKLSLDMEGFSGADIKAVCMEAAMLALRERMDGKNRKRIVQSHYERAIEKFKLKRQQAKDLGLDKMGKLYT